MTERAQAKATLESAFGREIPGGRLMEIADAFVAEDPFNLGGWYDMVTPDPVDDGEGGTFQPPDDQVPREPTNEEKAQLFNRTFRRLVRRTVRNVAERDADETERADLKERIKAVGDAAVEDLL